jgi:hypothetical protein
MEYVFCSTFSLWFVVNHGVIAVNGKILVDLYVWDLGFVLAPFLDLISVET